MCSVVGCESWRRGVQRYKLPEDPERRLEWVQFLFEVNGQQLQESNWTDITVCRDHFIKDCFENPTSLPDIDQLSCSAVPTLKRKIGPDKPPRPRAKPARKGPVYTDVDCQCDLETGSQPDSSNAISAGSDTGNAVYLPTKRKFAVNESCLLELFRHKCPSCDSKLQTEKITHGWLTILSQHCLECDYRYKWKSQIDASIPPAVEQHLTGGTEVTPETEQEMMTDNNPRDRFFSAIVSLSDEEGCPLEEEEEDDDDGGGATSDRDSNPDKDFLLAEELENVFEEESEEEYEDEEDEDWEEEEGSSDSQSGRGMKKLCPECGSFFYTHKPHTCEYKIKPFSCNICGKRCVTELSLHVHSRIHDENYEHPCKYCWVTFRTKTDKLKHEQVHQDNKDCYNCRKCPMTFTTSKKRRTHMSQHKKEGFKCGVCELEFPKKQHLLRHSVVHTGEKPHKCTVCERAFAQASHLKSHMRLHTGERPFKCQHCDKCFNHNVSLKSHVQRYHAGSSGPKSNKRKREKRETDSADADTNGNGKGSESEVDGDGENDAEEMPKIKRRWRRTGRPKGRPKKNIEGSNNKTTKQKGKKSKKMASSFEESDEEQSESDMSCDSAEEEETTRKSKGRSKRGPDKDSDSDFNPEEEMKGKSSTKTSGKQRGRTKKKKQEV
ncbi:zinc finger protein 888-like [Cheilinus undulatus]|uniref:zinc finger protein 888-like n=1 Tax=Cheilinus undulatus TaxID=241271 RepID=UPI001BD64780|nr:zinc finger protein 888-like [Cheilinus undulatus]